MNRVVVTGIGIISPVGIGAKAFWENLLAGKSGTIEARQVADQIPRAAFPNFVKVGKPNAAMLAHLARREDVEKRQKTLLQELEQVNKELAELDKTSGKKEKE